MIALSKYLAARYHIYFGFFPPTCGFEHTTKRLKAVFVSLMFSTFFYINMQLKFPVVYFWVWQWKGRLKASLCSLAEDKGNEEQEQSIASV